MSEKADLFEMVSPLDYRYYGRNREIVKELSPYFSENARISFQLRVEAAWAKALAKKGLCDKRAAKEIEKACKRVKAEEVYREEDRIKHDIRAMVNLIQKNVSRTKAFVHFGLTSYDVVDTANSLRFKEAVEKVLVPALKELERELIKLALREKKTLQIGRTHGQHAEPITFGFAAAEYVDRLGKRIKDLEWLKNQLRGKISGAVGAYNASSLLFENPMELEKTALKELGLEPDLHSTQILHPEPLADLVHEVVSAMGVMANFADDMRHLQRSEIAEVFESFEGKQVGSSTMPHKRNPINFENIKSFWKAFMPRMITVYSDQISEHQRDLTTSASSRFLPEIFVAAILTAKRLAKIVKNLRVDKQKMLENFSKSENAITAEPLYVLLAFHGHPNAHEEVRRISLEAERFGAPIMQLAKKEKSLQKYLEKFSKKQLELLKNPEKYTGLAGKKTELVCRKWKKELKL